MNSAASSSDSRLPVLAILGGAARCLVEDRLQDWLRQVQGEAEVRRFFDRAQSKDALLAEVREELFSGSLFGAARILITFDVKEPLKDDAVIGWMKKAGQRTRLWMCFTSAGARNELPEFPDSVTGSVVHVQGPRSPAEVRAYAAERARLHGAKLEPGADQALIEHTGADLDQIDSELEKLALYSDDGLIGKALIEALIGHGAEQVFDEFWNHLKGGRVGQALGLAARAANDGLRMFRGGATFGERETAQTLMFLLTSRIRRVAAAGAGDESVRDGACKALDISPSYAHFLRQDHKDIGQRRIGRWVQAAVAAELRQRTTGGPPPELNLEFLIHDLAKAS